GAVGVLIGLGLWHLVKSPEKAPADTPQAAESSNTILEASLNGGGKLRINLGTDNKYQAAFSSLGKQDTAFNVTKTQGIAHGWPYQGLPDKSDIGEIQGGGRQWLVSFLWEYNVDDPLRPLHLRLIMGDDRDETRNFIVEDKQRLFLGM